MKLFPQGFFKTAHSLLKETGLVRQSTLFSGPKVTPQNIHIGCLPAEATTESIEQELWDELKRDGWEAVSKRIAAEQTFIAPLEAQRAKFFKKVQTLTDTAVTRVSEGYSAQGIFWENLQNKIGDKTEYDEVEQKLDWLHARATVFLRMVDDLEHNENSPTYR